MIAEQMQRFGLGVDVDVIAQGRRTSGDSYGQFYAQLLADRPAAGQRSTMLVIRMDTRSPDTTAGLMWRTDTAAAVAAVTRRITRALRQSGCRAEPMTAADMRQAVLDMHGGSKEDIESTYREGWKDLTHRGNHVTSYYLSAEDLTAERLDDMWAISSEHTLLALHLRRSSEGITVSATVRFTTAQPLLAPPAVILNRYNGRQWWALSALLPGADRIKDMPTRTLTADLDTAVAIGSSGVMLGKVDDAFMLMPLRDPAGPTRIVIDSDDDLAVRQLIRRASASGEFVAAYDPPPPLDHGRSVLADLEHHRSARPTATPTNGGGAQRVGQSLPRRTGQHQRGRRSSVGRARCPHHPAQRTNPGRDRTIHRSPRRGGVPQRADISELGE
ncbi:hypothetical protein MARA_03430 (plasmid) [Mycolicibacterium arabiense]|uniref:Type VII secretion system protein EccE domain-containing protein n=1 Tax=Mycolicibacterium arabiense TaxID=1286181 RepID=A0A7I7RQW8_9MYCO|nr:hypothetical protein MARA_03430 [Mycolicibacterium arabiense]